VGRNQGDHITICVSRRGKLLHISVRLVPEQKGAREETAASLGPQRISRESHESTAKVSLR